jgi:serine/threonine protein kinase
MAPEQITAPETVQASADIYSLSCIFYELLAGALPVGHWQPPSRGRNDVPLGIDKLIDDGLSKNRWGRPQSVAEFRTRMREALKPPAPKPEPKPEPKPQPAPQPQPKAATPSAAPPPQPKAEPPARPKIDIGGQALSKTVESWLGITEESRPVPFSPGRMHPLAPRDVAPDAEKQGAALVAKAQAVAEEGRVKFNDGAREAAKAKWITAQQTFLLAIVRGSVEARFAYARSSSTCMSASATAMPTLRASG